MITWLKSNFCGSFSIIIEYYVDTTSSETVTDSGMARNFHQQMELKAELAMESEPADPTKANQLKAILNAIWLLGSGITLLDAWINSCTNKRIC